jgi:mycofactocin precursor
MFGPITEAPLTSAEIEVDAEFVLAAGQEPMVEAELLVEDISIDGMCGVY